MKKIASICMILVLIVLFPIQVFAVDFTIEKTRIDAYLQQDGTVEVTESHTYQFDDDFNGITRTIIPKEGSTVEKFSASENGSSLEFELEDGNTYKVYREGDSGETITFDLTYTIQDGMEIYNDVAQFYWPFFDKSNESDYEELDVFIHPPQTTSNVIALGYDEAQQTAETANDGVVHFDMGRVKSDRNGDIRVAYPQELFPAASLTDNQSVREDILAEQQRLKDERAAFQDRQEKISDFAPYILGAFAILFLVLIWSAWRSHQVKKIEAERMYPEHTLVPKEVMSTPATILYMQSMPQNAYLVTAALLDLVRKKYVKQEDQNTFTVQQRNTEHSHEAFLISWLFDKIGKNGTFHTEDLEAYTNEKSNHKIFHEDMQTWSGMVANEMEGHNLKEKKTKQKWATGLVALLMIPFAIISGIHQLFVWMFAAITLFISLEAFALFYSPKTVKGIAIQNKWKAFQRNYPDTDVSKVKKWKDNDQLRAIIYAIGLNDKKMNKKSEQMINHLPAAQDSSHNISGLLVLSASVQQSFSQAEQTVSATTGSAGTGAGAGGGGGGSGAF
ncbi:DUF2207 domain-containing protein [Salinibacillus aidingensis]|uniref:DUF2207 domain-containing protein n=1 Tax=Salinibacillus aidingensis TaxID=237684 RepID=A0ABN1B500_9BACI